MIILGGQLHFFVISEENGTQAQFFGFCLLSRLFPSSQQTIVTSHPMMQRLVQIDIHMMTFAIISLNAGCIKQDCIAAADQVLVVTNKFLEIQLNPALTDFRDPIIVFCYKRTFVIANKGNKRNLFEGTINWHLLYVEFRLCRVYQSEVQLYGEILLKGPILLNLPLTLQHGQPLFLPSLPFALVCLLYSELVHW